MSTKAEEFRRVWEELPDVLIQDAANDCAYHVSASQLRESHRATRETWQRIDASTATFVIPDRDVIEEVPPFLRSGTVREPSVLIQYRKEGESFFLTFEELQAYKVPQPDEFLVNSISFILPLGMEMIDEVSVWRKRLLQSVTGKDLEID